MTPVHSSFMTDPASEDLLSDRDLEALVARLSPRDAMAELLIR